MEILKEGSSRHGLEVKRRSDEFELETTGVFHPDSGLAPQVKGELGEVMQSISRVTEW